MRIKRPVPVPEAVRRLRESKGLTQEQFAKLVGCEQSHISKVERGDRAVSFDLAVELADRFHRPLVDFLDERRRRILGALVGQPDIGPAALATMTAVAQRIAWEVTCRNAEITPAEMWKHMPEHQRVNYFEAARAAQTLLTPAAGQEDDENHG